MVPWLEISIGPGRPADNLEKDTPQESGAPPCVALLGQMSEVAAWGIVHAKHVGCMFNNRRASVLQHVCCPRAATMESIVVNLVQVGAPKVPRSKQWCRAR